MLKRNFRHEALLGIVAIASLMPAGVAFAGETQASSLASNQQTIVPAFERRPFLAVTGQEHASGDDMTQSAIQSRAQALCRAYGFRESVGLTLIWVKRPGVVNDGIDSENHINPVNVSPDQKAVSGAGSRCLPPIQPVGGGLHQIEPSFPSCGSTLLYSWAYFDTLTCSQ